MATRATMNISLPRPLKTWVDRQVEEGGYGTASEFIRHLLREAKARDVALEESLVSAMDEGPAVPFSDAEWGNIQREGDRLASELRRRKRFQVRR